MTARSAWSLVAALPLLLGWDWLRSPDGDVERGRDLYRNGRYEEARDAFRAALGGGGDPARLAYNLGTALYKLGEGLPEGEEREGALAAAEDAFRRGADTVDEKLRSQAYYNLGNSLYQRKRYREAVDAYRKALRADPESEDARHNLELALRQIPREPPQPQAPQQEGQQGQQGQQGQEGQGGEQNQSSPDAGAPGQPGGADAGPPGADAGADAGARENQPDAAEGPDAGAGAHAGEEPDAGAGAHAGEEPDAGAAGPPPEPPPGPKESQAPEPPPAPGEPPPGGEGRAGRPIENPLSEAERKLDALERRSHALRKQKLRSSARGSGQWHLKQRKDW